MFGKFSWEKAPGEAPTREEIQRRLGIIQSAIEQCQRQHHSTTADGRKVYSETEERVVVDLGDGHGERELKERELLGLKIQLTNQLRPE